MKNIKFFLIALTIISCSKKEVLLPQMDKTIISKVENLSPVYIFYKVEGKDTIADVNRKNTISTTNWIFNIDKRLPLRLVIPEIIELQKKKESSMHKSETSENYFSYSDSIKKNLAFIPFTKVEYKMEKPFTNELRFLKNGKLRFNSDFIEKDKLQEFLNNLFVEHPSELFLSFDKKSSYSEYIENKIFINNLKITKKGISISNKEFVY